jgi:molybdopterin/thiamine biosynthesis adenylyltransferase
VSRVSLVLPDAVNNRLQSLSRLEIETGAVLLARPVVGNDGSIRLLARELIEVPDHAYEVRESLSLSITSDGYVPALSTAESTKTIPIWLHTHPGDGSNPSMSRHDEIVNEQIADLFRLRANSEYYGAVVVSHAGTDLAFTGFLDDGESKRDIDRIVSVGDRLSVVWNHNSEHATELELFDRNIRAFGGDIQRAICDLRIAIVGTGGTGSVVAEQLVRLGARNIDLYDPDALSLSNVTRVYGSTPDQVGTNKVDVVGDHLQAIAPDASITRTADLVTSEEVAKHLAEADVIFGCTDDNAGRMVLSRLPTFALVPVIDCGVLLSSDANQKLAGIDGRVTVVVPGSACLICRGRIDLRRAAAERMSVEEHERLAGEGYAPALAGVEPAVVAYTTAVAAAAVAELIERLVGYGPEPVPNELILRLHEREISTNRALPKPGHYCAEDSGKLALGVTAPFLETTW